LASNPKCVGVFYSLVSNNKVFKSFHKALYSMCPTWYDVGVSRQVRHEIYHSVSDEALLIQGVGRRVGDVMPTFMNQIAYDRTHELEVGDGFL